MTEKEGIRVVTVEEAMSPEGVAVGEKFKVKDDTFINTNASIEPTAEQLTESDKEFQQVFGSILKMIVTEPTTEDEQP